MAEMLIALKENRFGRLAALLVASLLISTTNTLAPLWAESVEEVVVAEPTADAAPTPVADVSHLANQLRLGMTYHEIVKLLGAPSERKEMEAKRSAVWEYGSHKIFFREGKVVAWTSVDSSLSVTDPVSPHVSGASPGVVRSPSGAKKEPADEETIRSLLGEIMESSQGGARPPAAAVEGASPDAEHGQDSRTQDPDRANLPPLVQQLSPY